MLKNVKSMVTLEQHLSNRWQTLATTTLWNEECSNVGIPAVLKEHLPVSVQKHVFSPDYPNWIWKLWKLEYVLYEKSFSQCEKSTQVTLVIARMYSHVIVEKTN